MRLERRKRIFTDEQRIEQQVYEWTINSHLWMDGHYNSQVCRWCGCVVGDGQTYPDTLCKENPAIKKLLKDTPNKEKS